MEFKEIIKDKYYYNRSELIAAIEQIKDYYESLAQKPNEISFEKKQNSNQAEREIFESHKKNLQDRDVKIVELRTDNQLCILSEEMTNVLYDCVLKEIDKIITALR